LRELLWRWEAVTYQGFMISSHIAASIYNSKRHKLSDRVWTWKDLHPQHGEDKQSANGVQVVATVMAMGAGEWQFMPGFSLDEILKG
jgi:hypothetical protein